VHIKPTCCGTLSDSSAHKFRTINDLIYAAHHSNISVYLPSFLPITTFALENCLGGEE
jgi:hypothetical protein